MPFLPGEMQRASLLSAWHHQRKHNYEIIYNAVRRKFPHFTDDELNRAVHNGGQAVNAGLRFQSGSSDPSKNPSQWDEKPQYDSSGDTLDPPRFE